MKNLFFKMFFIFIVCVGVEGGYAMSGGGFVMSKNKPRLKDAPMAMELYQHMDKVAKQHVDRASDQVQSDLKKVIEKHIPIGITADEAVSIAKRNHFKCSTGVFKNKDPKHMMDLSNDEEYSCAFNDLYMNKGGWISDNLLIIFSVRKNKVTGHFVSYSITGP